MKIFNFHLMPYMHADLDKIEQNGGSWVTFSNSNWDPEKGADLYHEYLDQLEQADALGFDGIAVNEHHQTAYGIMPVPGVLAGAMARRMKNGTLAVLGRALPLVNNPLTVAEEFAMLDNLMRGKFIAGFVRGIGAEYHSMPVSPAESAERFTEAHDLILQAWTRPGPFEFYGKHYQFKYVNPWPRPYSQPHPRIFCPSSGSISTIRWVVKYGYVYAQTLAPIANVAKIFDMYREEADKLGWQATPDHLAWSNSIYVGETDEKALRDARPHLEAYANRFLRTNPAFFSPPGYTTVESLKKQRAVRGTRPAFQSAEELIERGVVIVGSPNTVREKLAAYQDLAGFGISLTKTQFGTMPHSMVLENQQAIAQEVLPYFRDRVPQKAPKIAAE